MKKPYKNLTSNLEKQFAYSSNIEYGVISPIKRNNDSVILYNNDGSPQQVIVFEPEQIHILGSESDIKKFKEFIAKNKNK